MHDTETALAALGKEVKEARLKLGLSQAKLAENLGMNSRTILFLEAGRENPKFRNLHPLITYLKIPADRIFYPENIDSRPNLQELMVLLNNCTDEEIAKITPAVNYLIELLRK